MDILSVNFTILFHYSSPPHFPPISRVIILVVLMELLFSFLFSHFRGVIAAIPLSAVLAPTCDATLISIPNPNGPPTEINLPLLIALGAQSAVCNAINGTKRIQSFSFRRDLDVKFGFAFLLSLNLIILAQVHFQVAALLRERSYSLRYACIYLHLY